MNEPPAAPAPFVFCVCQIGMENVCKRDVLELNPFLAFAFSRPGFLTFKIQSTVELPATFELRTPFVRTSGWSLGKVVATEPAARLQEVVGHIRQSKARCIHVWQRDLDVPGAGDFEPGVSPLARTAAAEIESQLGARDPLAADHDTESTGHDPGRIWKFNQVADHGERVFDVVLVEPDSWWMGWHTAHSVPRGWPGGVPIFDLSQPVISRAYWKMAEAIAWCRFPVTPGHWCVELGAAPGGACQFLLERGLHVIAVDPAELDEKIRQHPHLVHLRCRSRDVRRSLLKHVRWLFADLNVAPTYTLDTVGDIVASSKVNIQGMLLTLKMMDFDLVTEIPKYMARVKDWGYTSVHVRQLAFNRREVCLMASRAQST